MGTHDGGRSSMGTHDGGRSTMGTYYWGRSTIGMPDRVRSRFRFILFMCFTCLVLFDVCPMILCFDGDWAVRSDAVV